MRSIFVLAMVCAIAGGCETSPAISNMPKENHATNENGNGVTTPCEEHFFYQDADADGYGKASVWISLCDKPQGYVDNASDCNDSDKGIHIGASEVCDGIDNDCNGKIDDTTKSWWLDQDHDGFGNAKFEHVGGCTGVESWLVTNALDCNDDDATIFPGMTEACNGKDDNCNGQTDENVLSTFYADIDGDGYGDVKKKVLACAPSAKVVVSSNDCDDTDKTVYPGAPELCDSKDNDCNGKTDEGATKTFFLDVDGDGHGNLNKTVQACSVPADATSINDDCDDGNKTVFPGAKEICNGVDDNCNEQTDEGVLSLFFKDADGDGHGDPNKTVSACVMPSGAVASHDDCDDSDKTVYPGASELCDNKDNDCDGHTDEAQNMCDDGDNLTTDSCDKIKGMCVHTDVQITFTCNLPKEFPWELGYTCVPVSFFEEVSGYSQIGFAKTLLAKDVCAKLKAGAVLHTNSYVTSPDDPVVLYVGGFYVDVGDSLTDKLTLGTPGNVTILPPGLDFDYELVNFPICK